MAVSDAVRRRYATRIFAQTTREAPPPNFRPMDGAATGRATVEGCRGGGKNILELFVRGDDDGVLDLYAACGLCNPAMMVAVDLVVDWARGRTWKEILALDVLDLAATAAILAPLGAGDAPPADALEKVRYALVALRHAASDHLGRPPPAEPPIPEPADADDEA